MSRHTGRISSFSRSPTGAAMPDVIINGSGFDARQDLVMSTFDESMRSQSTQSSAPYLHVNNMTTPSQDVARRSPTRCPCQRRLVVGLTILVMILILLGLTATTTLLITNNEISIGGTAALAATTIGETTDVTAFPNPTATTTTTSTTTTYNSGTATPNITIKYPTTTTTSPPATSSSSTTTTPLPTTTAPLSTSTNRPSTVTTSTSTVTTTSKTTTTTPGCSASRKCHGCSSHDARCPVNGTMAGTEPRLVISCPCGTECYSQVRYDDANTVHRGCVRDFATKLPESLSVLSCENISRSLLCFCHGDRCNTHDLTSNIP